MRACSLGLVGLGFRGRDKVGSVLGIGLVLGLAMVLGLAHYIFIKFYTFVHTADLNL